MSALCHRCQILPRIHKERFCSECKKAVMRAMEETGYLQRRVIGHVGTGRTGEMRQGRENELDESRFDK